MLWRALHLNVDIEQYSDKLRLSLRERDVRLHPNKNRRPLTPVAHESEGAPVIGV